MTLTEAQAVKRFYENELNGYAYLEGVERLKPQFPAFANPNSSGVASARRFDSLTSLGGD